MCVCGGGGGCGGGVVLVSLLCIILYYYSNGMYDYECVCVSLIDYITVL